MENTAEIRRTRINLMPPKRLWMELIEFARFPNNYFSNYSSFIRLENCERFCFYVPLSAFASSGQHTRIRPMCIFFPVEKLTSAPPSPPLPPPLYPPSMKSKGVRTPMREGLPYVRIKPLLDEGRGDKRSYPLVFLKVTVLRFCHHNNTGLREHRRDEAAIVRMSICSL